MFNDTQTNSAVGDALTTRIEKIFDVERYLDSPGTGTVILSRPSSGTGGTIYRGTRIELVDRSGLSEPIEYEVSVDTILASTATRTEIPIRALAVAAAVTAYASDQVYPRLVDSTWDDTWSVQLLTCAAGTSFEPAAAVIARARASRRDRRFGQERSIVTACMGAGAAHVALFPSNYGGDDIDAGLNWVYVGDGSYNASTSLIRSCVLALESARTLGDNMQVGAMVQTDLILNATVYLNDSPAKVNQTALTQRLQNYACSALRQDFTYSLDSIRAAMYQASPLVQDVIFSVPTSDAPLLTTTNGMLNFPATLSRHRLLPDNVTLTLRGPSV